MFCVVLIATRFADFELPSHFPIIHIRSGPMSIQNHHRGPENISLSSHIGLNVPSLGLPMSSNENPLQLTLSDIMHHMSPSPVSTEESRPVEDSDMGGPYLDGSRREREGSPEQLTETDVVGMRRRLHALGFSLERDRNELGIDGEVTRPSNDFGNTTSREKELVNMVCCPLCINPYISNRKFCQVLRLTDSLPVDATQLERQADVISTLTSQRDFLVRQAEEDRERWHSEREGWDRMAEALLSHKSRTGKSTAREDVCYSSFYITKGFYSLFFKETERQKVQLESENRALRDKVCIYYLTHCFPPTSLVKILNFIDLFSLF